MGTRQIYEHMKKRLALVDERPTSTRSTKMKEKYTPPKTTAHQTPKYKKIEDQEAVQVTGQHIPGHTEEKSMQYRKEKLSSVDLDLEDNYQSFSDTDKNEGIEDQVQIGEPENQELKCLFVELIDAQPTMDIGHVQFTWTKPHDVTFTVLAAKPASDTK